MTYVPSAIATHTPPRPTMSPIAAVDNFLRPNRTDLCESAGYEEWRRKTIYKRARAGLSIAAQVRMCSSASRSMRLTSSWQEG